MWLFPCLFVAWCYCVRAVIAVAVHPGPTFAGALMENTNGANKLTLKVLAEACLPHDGGSIPRFFAGTKIDCVGCRPCSRQDRGLVRGKSLVWWVGRARVPVGSAVSVLGGASVVPRLFLVAGGPRGRGPLRPPAGGLSRPRRGRSGWGAWLADGSGRAPSPAAAAGYTAEAPG